MLPFRRIASAISSTIRVARQANTLFRTSLRARAYGTVFTKAFHPTAHISIARFKSNIATSGQEGLGSEVSQSTEEASGEPPDIGADEAAWDKYLRDYNPGEFVSDEPYPEEGPNDTCAIAVHAPTSWDGRDPVALEAKMRAWMRNAEDELMIAASQEDGTLLVSADMVVTKKYSIWIFLKAPAYLRPVVKWLVRECPDIYFASPYDIYEGV